MKKSEILDVRKSFEYADEKERELFHMNSQDSIHEAYRNIIIDQDKCVKCGKCSKSCPVNIIDQVDGEFSVSRVGHYCLLCTECYHICPVNAVRYEYINKAGKRLEKMRHKLESPQSAVYPLATN